MSRVLVVAKAPVPGAVKTRLGTDIGLEAAAEIAAAALLDTLRACASAYPPPRRHLALAGDLTRAVRGAEIEAALDGWDVFGQEGSDFAERLVHAHVTVARRGEGPVIQIGMDTPQVTPDLLHAASAALDDSGQQEVDAVLGPALDGGWWVLVLRDGRRAAPLAGVVMSTPQTYDDTRAVLEAAGLRVADTAVLVDIDTVDDADRVAAQAPTGLFAQAWVDLRGR